MNNTELTHLAERAARAMAGRPVMLRFRVPAVQGAKATAFRLHGAAFVDITPGLDQADFLHTLCHEAGHIRDLWHEWKVDQPDRPTGSVRIPPILDGHPVVKKIEKTAETLAGQWEAYAEANHRRYKGGWLESRLRALAEWSDPELEAKINQWVDRAVTRAVKRIVEKNRR